MLLFSIWGDRLRLKFGHFKTDRGEFSILHLRKKQRLNCKPLAAEVWSFPAKL